MKVMAFKRKTDKFTLIHIVLIELLLYSFVYHAKYVIECRQNKKRSKEGHILRKKIITIVAIGLARISCTK